ncbi:MAG: DUF362 domain-containing protein [Desulfobacteraceae bacterium]|nr:DUF362 domain-containing protein [Desulfobacteraceae bacterium]
MVKVSITKAEDDLYAALTEAIDGIGERPIARGDRVLIKPNLVEPRDPGSGAITTPGLIEAVARYCLDQCAAKVVIGEGPSYYQPESRMRDCFTDTGVTEIAERLGIDWVLFDEHNYRTFRDISDYTPAEFRITEFVFTCDKLINLPVLKTHYLTKVTLAMKNLKGCLKRENKPRFHDLDLSRAVVELCKIVKPTINIIDCTAKDIVRQIGTGYPEEKKGSEGLLIAGIDIVAVDAVGCALMGIDPTAVSTVSLGATAGLGENELTRIDIVGEELRRLKFKVKLPQEEIRQSFPLLEIIGAEKACSGCLIPLLSGLRFLREQGIRLEKPLVICLGKKPDVPENKRALLVGDCALDEDEDNYDYIPGCPPSREELVGFLAGAMTGLV